MMSHWQLPALPKRAFLERFFTFLAPLERSHQFLQGFRWQKEVKLQHNLKCYQQQDEAFLQFCQIQNDSELVGKLLSICQDVTELPRQQLLAQWHLVAYLEAPAYQAIKQIKYKDFENPLESWFNYFHIAKCLINQPDKIARFHQKYNPEIAGLEQYFESCLRNQIRDTYHQQTGKGKYSVWLSLKKASQVKLTTGLIQLGIPRDRASNYITARDCLFQVFSRTGKRWLKPTEQQYQTAALLCSQQYFTCTVGEFKQLINTVIQALQFSPKIDCVGENIETYLFAQAKQDAIAVTPNSEGNMASNPWAILANKLERILEQTIVEIEADLTTQLMFLLRYGLELSEPAIALQLGVNQATINRRCARLQKQILKVIIQELQQQNNLEIKALDAAGKYLEIWLYKRYKFQVNHFLYQEFTQQLNTLQKEALQAQYFTEYDLRLSAHFASSQERDRIAEQGKIQLLERLKQWLQNTYQTEIKATKMQKALNRFIEKWLTQTSSN
jgi:hypothetical protein